MMELIQLANSKEGKRLIEVAKRLAEYEKKDMKEIVGDATDILERLEKTARRKGIKVSQAAKESLDLYERAP